MGFFHQSKASPDESHKSVYRIEKISIAFEYSKSAASDRNLQSLEMSKQHKFDRFTALCQGLIDWSKAKEDQIHIQIKETDVKKLLEDEYKKIMDLHNQMDADLLIIKADMLKDGKPDGSHYVIYTQHQNFHDALMKLFANNDDVSIRKFDTEFEFYSDLKPGNTNQIFIPINVNYPTLILNIGQLHIDKRNDQAEVKHGLRRRDP